MRSPTANRAQVKSQMKLPGLLSCPNLSLRTLYRCVLQLLLIVAAIADLRVYSGIGGHYIRYGKEEEEEEPVEPVATSLNQT